MNTRNKIISAGVLWIAGIISAHSAQAQVASVTAVQNAVDKRAAGAWTAAKKGTPLAPGDALRTGKRSGAGIRFDDGSTANLGQLSSVDIQALTADTTRVFVEKGRILFVKVKVPGNRKTFVSTGTGAAEIKGSVAIIEAKPDGSGEYSLYSGSMSVSNKDGTRTVDVPVGHWVRTNVDNTISEIGLAPPLVARGDVTQAPQNGPFAGSRGQVSERLAPAEVSLDSNLITASPEVINSGANPFVPSGGVVSPTPLPTFPPGGALVGGRRVVRLNSQLGGPSRAAASAVSAAPAITSMAAQATKSVLLAQATGNPDAGTAANVVADQAAAAGAAATGADIDVAAATKHFEEVDAGNGKISGVDYRAIGLVGSDSLRGVFGRLHLFAQQGKIAGDIVLAPQLFQFDGIGGRVKRDRIVVPQAMLTYQDQRFAVIGGRQRYLAGPIRASFYGSMVRSGGREVMDALRFVPKLGRDYGLEVSYLYDAFPRYIPYDIKGRQQGYYGRLSAQKSFGNFGLNMLRYKDSPVSSTTGFTLDFAVPLVRNKVELYGEVGKDPFRRKLRTIGVALPFIYERTGFDVYIEHARLSNSGTSVGQPGEFAVRVYRTLSSALDVVATYNHFKGSGSQVLLGLSLGGRKTFRSKGE